MPLAYLHGQLIGSLLSDGFLMGWEDGLLNTAQLLRFNYRTRLPLSQRWHPGGGLGAGGRRVPDSCLGSRWRFPPPHRNARFPVHAAVPLTHATGEKTAHRLLTPQLTFSKRLLSVRVPREVAGNLHIQHFWESDPGRHAYNCGASVHSGTGLLLFHRSWEQLQYFGEGAISPGCSLRAEAHDSHVPPPLLSQ